MLHLLSHCFRLLANSWQINGRQMEVQLDRIGIVDLEKQYGISRSVLHERMNALNIKRTKIGNKSYIDSSAIQLLDELHAHIKSKQPMALFLEKIGIQQERHQSTDKLATLVPTVNHQSTDNLESRLVIQLLPAPTLVHPLENHRILLETARDGFVLPTSQLLPLLSRKSLPALDDHNRFNSHGFTFWKSGKMGNEYGWRVTKQQV